MTFDDLVTLFQEKSATTPGFGGTLRLDIEGAGTLFIDGTDTPVQVHPADDPDADTQIHLDFATLKGLVSGDLNPALAFMTGKLKVSGNMGLAMKLQGLMGED